MKLRLLSICFFAAFSAHAQPTLTAAANNFTAGLSFQQYNVPSAPQGASGANAVWDFSGIGTSASNPYSYAACSVSSNCSTFVGSNIVTTQAGGGTGYWIVDNNRQALNGVSGGGTDIIYSNPQDVLRFPFTYNSTFSDTYAASFVSGGVAFNRSGTITVTADGYGTLKLPNGTFTNVLRVKRVDNFTDTWSGPTLTYVSEMYTWYAPGYREYLLSKTISTVNGVVTNNPLLYNNQVPGPNSIGNVSISEENVHIYPNPARVSTGVHFESTKGLHGQIAITDISGRSIVPVQTFSARVGMNEIKINTLNLSPGIYLMRLMTDEQIITRKLEVL